MVRCKAQFFSIKKKSNEKKNGLKCNGVFYILAYMSNETAFKH